VIGVDYQMNPSGTSRHFLCALALLAASSIVGHSVASSFDDGLPAYERGDYASALEGWRPLAEAGNARAQFYLGIMSRDGQGLTKDDAQAVAWLRKAAEQGDADAQTDLGYMYETARGIEWDDSRAVEWYGKAAQQGNPRGQFGLGAMYARTRGVEKSDATAVDWFRKAAEQGDASAQTALGYMYALGRGVTKDDAQALEWYRKAAAQGNGDAEANLGNVFTQGRGVAPDQVEAAGWYHQAAAHGNARAKRILASLEHNGAVTAIAPDAALPLATKPDTKPVKTVMAEYPLGARRDQVTGHVTGRMLIDEDGSVVAVQIVSATPRRIFDRAARAAFEQWKFKAHDAEWVGEITMAFDFR
jgi:TonB family protein